MKVILWIGKFTKEDTYRLWCPCSARQYKRIEPSFSMTLLVNMKKKCPFYINTRKQSNTEEDFLEFLLKAAEAGYIAKGDIVVCDNAFIHYGGNWES